VTLLLMLLGLFALILINVPIAIALALVGVIAMLLTQGSDVLPNVGIVMFEGARSFPLLAIPMFILAGALMNASSISRRLFAFASALLGFIRGGLAMVNIGVSMFFSELSGSAVAGVAATAPVLIPAMHKRGYPRPFTAAVTSSSATLAIILPPSVPMILYGVMAETSIVQLFVAGIVPGLLPVSADDAAVLLFRAPLRLAGRGGFRSVPVVGHLQGGILGAVPAGHHPGRNIRRHRHRYRRRSAWRSSPR
jgi:C4-dicarboxylate transporter, DctM subunit